MGSVTINGSTSGSVTVAAPAVAGSNTLTLPAATGTVLTSSGDQTTTGTFVMSSPYTMRNKIINGAMVIDQRNAGASGTAITAYTVDRWKYGASQASKFTWQQNAGSVTPPTGFSNYLGFTSSSSYSVLAADYFGVFQVIEGFNTADLAFGTASAQTVTLSFWARSSLTGTFSGSLINGGATRSYPFTYTISSANTWEQKTITIAGDTTGTWATNNTGGMYVNFSLGAGSTYSATAGAWASGNYVAATGATSVVGTNGATFYITGVQLERGTVATPFEYRNYQQELAMCQRYYETNYPSGVAPGATDATNPTYLYMDGLSVITHTGQQYVQFKVVKRATPTITMYSPNNGASGVVYDFNGTTNRTAGNQYIGPWSFIGYSTSLGSANNINMAFNWTASIEL